MAVVFDVNSMRDDFRVFAKAAAKFIQGKTTRFHELEVALDYAVRHAHAAGREFTWSTKKALDPDPIRTIPSDTYRNAATLAKKLVAEITFDLQCELIGIERSEIRVASGSTAVSFFKEAEDGGPLKEVHFDIHGADVGSTAGHPVLHVQVLGGLNDIPRIPIPFVHPLDVLEFTLMELFQAKWRTHRTDSETRSALGRFPSRQACRIGHTIRWMFDRMWDGSPYAPLLALQKQPQRPFNLYDQLTRADSIT
jgi:hypothetical protein